MVNFIKNELELVGDDDAIAKTKSLLLKDDALSFEALMPTPTDGYPNENVWRCENWGTKWDAQKVENLEPHDGVVGWRFFTGWSAPELWFRDLAAVINNIDIGRIVVTLSWADPSDSTGCHMTRNAAGVVERTDMTTDEAINFLGVSEDE